MVREYAGMLYKSNGLRVAAAMGTGPPVLGSTACDTRQTADARRSYAN